MSEVPELPEVLVRFYPTTIRLPLWVRPLTLRSSLSTLRIGDFSLRRVSTEFSIKGLFRSPYRPDLKPTLNPAEILEDVKI